MVLEQRPIEQYQQQLDEKVSRLRQLLAEFNPPLPDVYSSPINHYRMRAEFRIWHDHDDLYHIMFDPSTRERIRVDHFPIACQLINQLMAEMIQLIKPNRVLRHKLFQIDYLTTLSNQAIISLLYHCKLDDEWQQNATRLRDTLRNQGYNIQIIGRATRQKICLDYDYIDEMLPVAGKTFIYRQIENSFTQPNAAINIKMLEWARSVTQHASGDLLELYCGNGNFSIALADNFRQVLATEIAKSSVAAAQYNIAVNHCNNVQIIRMSAEEFTQAMQGIRNFNRLKHINLDDYQCDTILVDPPRSGLDIKTTELVQGYKQIVYISCNPATLSANLQTLYQSHYIEKLALFDQFPYTHHIECGVLLKQRI